MLVAVLGLLVLSTTLLVAVGRAATRAALAARSAEEDLQRRWGVITCRRAVLPYAEQMLTALEQERRRPVPKFEASVRLGGMTFDLVVADEQAKVNVNTMLQAADVTSVETRIRTALSGTGLANAVKLRPTLGPVVIPVEPTTAPTTRAATQPVRDPIEPTVGAFSQVFTGVSPGRLLRPSPGSRVAAVDLLTVWTKGPINARRAPAAALQLAAGRSLSRTEIDRLVEAREAIWERKGVSSEQRTPAEQLKDQIAKAVGESAKNRGNLALVESSACHSLWVVTRNARRDWYDLAVIETTDADRPRVTTFSW